jgi:hypothetical protein
VVPILLSFPSLCMQKATDHQFVNVEERRYMVFLVTPTRHVLAGILDSDSLQKSESLPKGSLVPYGCQAWWHPAN